MKKNECDFCDNNIADDYVNVMILTSDEPHKSCMDCLKDDKQLQVICVKHVTYAGHADAKCGMCKKEKENVQD